MLPSATHIGSVHLTVADLEAQRSFYERALGLRELERDGSTVRLGPEGGPVILELTGDPDAPRRPHGTTGLYHFAVLVPEPRGPRPGAAARDRVRLALHRRLRPPGERGALPERPRGQRHRDLPRPPARGVGARDEGEMQMATLPLDLDGVLGEIEAAEPVPATHARRYRHRPRPPAGGEPPRRRRFYSDTLGFEVMVRTYPGALFVSAGGYHHHIGAQHLGERGRLTAPGRLHRPTLLRARPPKHRRRRPRGRESTRSRRQHRHQRRRHSTAGPLAGRGPTDQP